MKRQWPFPLNRWGDIEPWPWLRHITPWPVLNLLFDRYHLCWAGMVMWKQGSDFGWRVRPDCIYPHDYCGHYDHAGAEERAEGLRIANENSGPMITFKEEG